MMKIVIDGKIIFDYIVITVKERSRNYFIYFFFLNT